MHIHMVNLPAQSSWHQPFPDECAPRRPDECAPRRPPESWDRGDFAAITVMAMQAQECNGRQTSDFTLADAQHRAADSPFVWIDVRAASPTDPEVAPLLTALGFDRVVCSLAMRTNVTGMFAEFGGNIAGVTWLGTSADSDPAELHFSWNPRMLVTVRLGGDGAIAEINRLLLNRGPGLFDQPTVMLGVFLQMVLASVDREITSLDEQVSAIDTDIIEAVRPEQLAQLRALRTRVAPLSRRFPGYRDAVREALVDPTSLPGMDAPGASHLQTYGAHVGDVVGRIDDLMDAVRSAAQDYQSEVGNQQGNRINQLTIVSVLFLPISFLTGYFGMNFQWLDNQLLSMWTWVAFGVVLPVVTLLASIAILGRLGYVRRRRARFAREGADSDASPES